MIFALGFLCAGMLTLFFLPVFWRRAMRLSARKLELQMPLSMSEIVAERDQLRAEFAAERRKLEQTSEKLSASLARGRAELGERSKRIAAQQSDLENMRRDLEAAAAEIDSLNQELASVELERAAIEKTHYDAAGLLERRSAELLQLTRDHRDLNDVSDDQRTTIAGLETRAATVEMKLDVTEDELIKTRKALDEKISLAQFMERERDQFGGGGRLAAARGGRRGARGRRGVPGGGRDRKVACAFGCLARRRF